MKNILFGLLPALMWGAQPIVMTKLGGRPTRKVMGMALGIFIAALFLSIFKRPDTWTFYLIFFSFLDGLALSFGLINQIKGLAILGVAKGTPVSTGSQLVGASLIGALYFKEWSSSRQYILGSLALVIIILGVSMTSYQEDSKLSRTNANLKKGILVLILSSLGFVAYTVILRLTDISIWDALLPQSLGMLLGSYLLARREDDQPLFVAQSFRHIVTGFIFAIGNISLMLSNLINGLALGFTLTQMNVVIATLGGLLILGEKKTRKELILTLSGLVLVVLGGVLIGLTKL